MTSTWRVFSHVPRFAAIWVLLCVLVALVVRHLNRARPEIRAAIVRWTVLAAVAGSVVLVVTHPVPSFDGRELGLVPFQSLGERAWVSQTVGNLILFSVVGLAMGWAIRPGRRAVAVCLGFVLTVELVQLAFPLGRVAAVEDVLVGGLAASVGAVLISRARPRSPPT